MKNFLALSSLLLLFACNNVYAQSTKVMGKVVSVENLTRTVGVERPHTSCHVVDIPIYGPSNSRGASTNDTIVGAIIGGALGNQVGGGSGRDAATVLGAIIGADVANKRNRGSVIVGYRQENRCITEYITELQQQSDGYKITVEVENTLITTITNQYYNVGDTIEVSKQYSF